MNDQHGKGGRPPKPEGERKSSTVLLRITLEQRERYEQAAEAKGQSLSDWIRSVCDRAAKRQSGR
jgi:uncharacterized protein (DUF1778 family)